MGTIRSITGDKIAEVLELFLHIEGASQYHTLRI
jgi:hypothetical protein